MIEECMSPWCKGKKEDMETWEDTKRIYYKCTLCGNEMSELKDKKDIKL